MRSRRPATGGSGSTARPTESLDSALKNTSRVALVLGAEGEGLRLNSVTHCDMLARLPMSPRMESLQCFQRGGDRAICLPDSLSSTARSSDLGTLSNDQTDQVAHRHRRAAAACQLHPDAGQVRLHARHPRGSQLYLHLYGRSPARQDQDARYGRRSQGRHPGLEKGAEKPTLYKSAYLTDLKGRPIAAAKTRANEDFNDTKDEAGELKTLAEALSKEYGFRSVKYIGNRKLLIDYSISGKLDHAFVFPFNPDADVLLPFIAIELRGKDKLRVKAPGYANQQSMSASLGGLGGMPAMGADADASSALDGTFTLTTNATIVSQNQEDGAQPAPIRHEKDRVEGQSADQGSAARGAAGRAFTVIKTRRSENISR